MPNGQSEMQRGRRIMELAAQIQEIMNQAIASSEAAGVSCLVQKQGQEILHACAGYADAETGKKLTRDSIFRLYSQSKPITAASVMVLVEEGRLDLFDEARKYLPGFDHQQVIVNGELQPVRRPVTVMDLLGMMSGLPYPDADQAGQAMAALFEKNESLMDEGRGMDTVTFANQMGMCPLAFQPGSAFRYGTSADVLGAIVEVVSGMKFADFLKERIFEPLGMKDTDFYVPAEKKDRLVTCYQRTEKGLEVYPVRHLCVRDHDEQPAFASGGAGLMSTLDDYMAFARMLLQKGEYNGKRILEKKTVEWMTQPQIDSTGWDNLTGFAYGRLMRVCTEPGKASVICEKSEYGWDGWLGTYFANLPGSDMTLLIFQNTRDTGTGRVTRCVRNRIVSALCGVNA